MIINQDSDRDWGKELVVIYYFLLSFLQHNFFFLFFSYVNVN